MCLFESARCFVASESASTVWKESCAIAPKSRASANLVDMGDFSKSIPKNRNAHLLFRIRSGRLRRQHRPDSRAVSVHVLSSSQPGQSLGIGELLRPRARTTSFSDGACGSVAQRQARRKGGLRVAASTPQRVRRSTASACWVATELD